MLEIIEKVIIRGNKLNRGKTFPACISHVFWWCHARLTHRSERLLNLVLSTKKCSSGWEHYLSALFHFNSTLHARWHILHLTELRTLLSQRLILDLKQTPAFPWVKTIVMFIEYEYNESRFINVSFLVMNRC